MKRKARKQKATRSNILPARRAEFDRKAYTLYNTGDYTLRALQPILNRNYETIRLAIKRHTAYLLTTIDKENRMEGAGKERS